MAFYECFRMNSINLSVGLIRIGNNAFSGCRGLTSITIPESVTNIGNYAFRGCSNLAIVTLPECMIDIPEGIFCECSSLTSVTIPESVTEIGNSVFHGCGNLASVNIPDNSKLTSIGEWAFFSCSSLTSINIPEGVTSLGNHAFESCSSLTNITLPDNLTSIGDNTFGNCSFATIIFPDGLTSIGGQAFAGCNNLASVAIPESVVCIGENAFYGTAWYNNQPDGVIYVGNFLYDYKGDMPSGTSVEVKEGTISIVGAAFCWCRGLTSITIPESVTVIGESAFAYCDGLTDLTLHSNSLISANAIPSTTRVNLVLNDKEAADFNVGNANTYDRVVYNRELGAGRYGTIMLPFAPDAESVDNFVFYSLSSVDGETLFFDEVAAPIANTPYLYTLREGKTATQITGGETTISSVITNPEEVNGWQMTGSFTNRTIATSEDADSYYYAYSSADNQLHKVTKTLNVKSYRAYFVTDIANPAQLAVRTRNGETTFIDATEVEDFATGACYDLSGRRVANPTKGIYIVNGKKVIL